MGLTHLKEGGMKLNLSPVGVSLAPPSLPWRAHAHARTLFLSFSSHPDGWLHRSAWVSFMIPGSPTSLARPQPAPQANGSLSAHTLSLTHKHTHIQHQSAATSHPESSTHFHTLFSEDPSRRDARQQLQLAQQGSTAPITRKTAFPLSLLVILFQSRCHNVRSAAIQRGQNERLWGRQWGQPDVL